ncbi:MAG: SpoIID/LytB domain-containing protein [Fusobacteriaceae bacterium]|nr:SpoIID/LytB domain-containing protein [Fusobacteriaceae bacterium]MBN2839096.1 SpoIID/LytB domain-containing protein [Fusobacteriaceae bacterium]
MIKKIIIMFFLALNLMAYGEFEDSFGPLLKVGITKFQNSKIYLKAYNGDFIISADNENFIVREGEIAIFYTSKGKLAYGDYAYNKIRITRLLPNVLLGLSKNNSSFSKYRGDFELKIVNSKIMPINNIYAEEYLYSVVPSEIGNSFPDEAIKAQSVAARSYLYYNLGTSKYSYCDLLDNVNSQMYLGYDRESSNINRLVNETFNEVLVYDGKPIEALFHSTSGGKTASNEDVWPSGKPIPYLRGVDDTGNGTISPRENWVLEVTKSELNNIAGFIIKDINILETGNDRVKYIELIGTSKKKKYTGEELRRALGVNRLNSTMFTIEEKENSFIFTGSGFGHGLGMPQYSAYTMAESGKNYKEILLYYYSGVKLIKY